ncbi:MAG TPA: EamA family transporter [Opitutaceae bacterium]
MIASVVATAMWRYLLLFLSIFAMSTSVIWIKAGTTHPFVVAALRLLIACVFLAPVFLRDRARHREVFTRDHLRRTLLPAVLLAAHFLSWTAGARMTGSAQASLIVILNTPASLAVIEPK